MEVQEEFVQEEDTGHTGSKISPIVLIRCLTRSITCTPRTPPIILGIKNEDQIN